MLTSERREKLHAQIVFFPKWQHKLLLPANRKHENTRPSPLETKTMPCAGATALPAGHYLGNPRDRREAGLPGDDAGERHRRRRQQRLGGRCCCAVLGMPIDLAAASSLRQVC